MPPLPKEGKDAYDSISTPPAKRAKLYRTFCAEPPRGTGSSPSKTRVCYQCTFDALVGNLRTVAETGLAQYADDGVVGPQLGSAVDAVYAVLDDDAEYLHPDVAWDWRRMDASVIAKTGFDELLDAVESVRDVLLGGGWYGDVAVVKNVFRDAGVPVTVKRKVSFAKLAQHARLTGCDVELGKPQAD